MELEAHVSGVQACFPHVKSLKDATGGTNYGIIHLPKKIDLSGRQTSFHSFDFHTDFPFTNRLYVQTVLWQDPDYLSEKETMALTPKPNK